MKTKLSLLFLLFLGGIASGQYIQIRVSVKVIVHATSGARPFGITDQLFYDAAEAANEWRALYYRGYRFTITEVVNIGGPTQGGATGPSKWYNTDPRDAPEPWNTFQSNINTDARYQRRLNDVNVYITGGVSGDPGGACPIPPGESNNISCQGFVNDGPWWMNHELGHFFGLPHTFNGEGVNTPGDDGISDTLPDCNCWTSLAQVQAYYPFESQVRIEDCYYNVMSYHEAVNKDTVENRMTEGQLDRIADIANTNRAAFVTGRTRFLSLGGSDATGNGSSTAPYRTIGKGVNIANPGGGDILLVRPGSYNEQITINKPVTLRAPRTGWATIGRP